MMINSVTAAGRATQPRWLTKFVAQDGRSDGWTVYAEGLRYAVAKRIGKDAEYHILEKHRALITVEDRSLHRLIWKGNLTKAGRNYITITLALSNAAGKIIREDGKAQCTQCRALMPLSLIGTHPCQE